MRRSFHRFQFIDGFASFISPSSSSSGFRSCPFGVWGWSPGIRRFNLIRGLVALLCIAPLRAQDRGSLEGQSTSSTSPTPTATASRASSPVIISGTVGRCTSDGPSAFPLPNVTMILTGSATETTVTDSLGNYTFSVAAGGSYTVTPSKAAFLPGAAGFTTTDVFRLQLYAHSPPPPILTCIYSAADCAAPIGISTGDIIAVQRFFLNFTNGIGHVGEYKFDPLNRSYSSLTRNQTDQDYDSIVLGDVTPPWAGQ